MIFCTFVYVIFFINTIHSSENRSKLLCKYEHCPKPKSGLLNLHLISHTHLDAGWVSTYDEYYYQSVRDIITSVVLNLNGTTNRRFIFVETCYFARWWKEQDNPMKDLVRKLVINGTFEWISGGWVMNDEAVPNYQQIIDQMTLGHRWLNRTFNECGRPMMGWQIDPFGHSKEYATILAEMGFDAFFMGRIDYQDKLQREQTHTLEFMWKTSESLGEEANIFSGILPNVYWPPNGFCWDVMCSDEQMSDSNALMKAKFIINLAKEQGKKYKTNNTLIAMGNDFTHKDAGKWFRNLDKLVDAINKLQESEGVYAFYSTTSCYLKALHESNQTWPLMVGDDFFPYADKFNAYWSGYYTSRPTIKYFTYYANNFLQAAKQLSVLSNLNNTLVQKLDDLQGSMAILMHHDAIAGTEKQYVTEDYIRMLFSDLKSAEDIIVAAFNRLSIIHNQTTFHFCHNLNISECSVTEELNESLVVIVTAYNPIAQSVNSYIKIPVNGTTFKVQNLNGTEILSQIVLNHPFVNGLPDRKSSSNSTLIFPVKIPPFGIESFLIKRMKQKKAKKTTKIPSHNETTITNGKITVFISNSTGLMTGITLPDNRKVNISQSFYGYEAEGILSRDKPSGAYAFNPVWSTPSEVASGVEFKIFRGLLVEEVHQTFSTWISQVIRVYKDKNYVEFDWTVGPIPIDGMTDEGGLEIVTKFITNIKNNGSFYTDSNGKESIQRLRHKRRTWNLSTTEPVASNYYPITNAIFIKDEKQNLQLSVIPDRPQGGSSMCDGCIELMVHRRLLHDDGFGVVEPLNEKGIDRKGLIVRGKHWILFNNINDGVRQLKTVRKELQNELILAFSKRNKKNISDIKFQMFSGLKKKLPKNINVLTLEHWDDERILLRLEHLFERNEHSKYSAPRSVSLKHLFAPFTIQKAIEVSLNAVHLKNQSQQQRLRWNFENSEPNFYSERKNASRDATGDTQLDYSLNITISAMQIRTFLVTVDFKE